MDAAELAAKMRREWDERARENAFYYVASSHRDWRRDEFFGTGREAVLELIVRELETLRGGRRPRRMRALEIGCGVGRMTRWLAKVFGEAHGVDVSGEMVERGRELLADVPNAHLHHGNGVDLSALSGMRFDFAFSFIVFQHIPSRKVVAGYVRETARRLRPGAWFKFQLQGDSSFTPPEHDTWLGAPFSETQAREMTLDAGLEPMRLTGAGSQYFLGVGAQAALAEGTSLGLRGVGRAPAPIGGAERSLPRRGRARGKLGLRLRPKR